MVHPPCRLYFFPAKKKAGIFSTAFTNKKSRGLPFGLPTARSVCLRSRARSADLPKKAKKAKKET